MTYYPYDHPVQLLATPVQFCPMCPDVVENLCGAVPEYIHSIISQIALFALIENLPPDTEGEYGHAGCKTSSVLLIACSDTHLIERACTVFRLLPAENSRHVRDLLLCWSWFLV